MKMKNIDKIRATQKNLKSIIFLRNFLQIKLKKKFSVSQNVVVFLPPDNERYGENPDLFESAEISLKI